MGDIEIPPPSLAPFQACLGSPFEKSVGPENPGCEAKECDGGLCANNRMRCPVSNAIELQL